MTDKNDMTDMMSFDVRLIFKDTNAIDLNRVAETAKDAMLDMLRMHVSTIKMKKYGLLMSGRGSAEMLRIGEAVYPLTNDGGLEIIVHVGKKEIFYMKEGLIHDLRDKSITVPVPRFSDDSGLMMMNWIEWGSKVISRRSPENQYYYNQ